VHNRECPALVRDECTTWLGELDAVTPSIVFAAVDEQQRDVLGLRIQLNGKSLDNYVEGRAVSLDPGAYEVRFEAQGYEPVVQKISLRDGEKGRVIHAQLASVHAAAPTPHGAEAAVDARSKRLWLSTYTLGAASIVSFAVAVGASARGKHMQKHCNDDDCSDAYASHGKDLYRAVNVSLLAGGALALVTAGTLWGALHHDKHARDDVQTTNAQRLQFSASADRQGASLFASGQW